MTIVNAYQDGEYQVTEHSDGTVIRELPRAPEPAFVKSWSAFDFYRKFTLAERIRVRALAATDPIANDIIHTLDSAMASGTPVRADDPETIDGLAYLSVNPSGDPAITPARAIELLAA